MLAISIWQPHATLIALALKPFETRHWRPSPGILARVLGHRIAIHASKNTSDLRNLATHIRDKGKGFPADPAWSPYVTALALHAKNVTDLPLGAIVGTAVLKAVHPCTEDKDFGPFGYFAPGRFAWELSDVIAFKQPVPWIGRQGWFDIPDDIIAQAV